MCEGVGGVTALQRGEVWGEEGAGETHLDVDRCKQAASRVIAVSKNVYQINYI